MTRAEMYQTVRDSLSDCYVDALAALAALEAEERDAAKSRRPLDAVGRLGFENGYVQDMRDATPPAPHSVYCECLICDPPSAPNEVTPPAPPAADTIAAAFARDFFVRHDHSYSGVEIYEWLKKQVTGPAAPPAAECAARKALKIQRKAWDGVVQREADGPIVDFAEAQIRRIDTTLAAPCDVLNVGPILVPIKAIREAAAAVAAYDAKHGESDAPSQDYSECPNCHVTLYHSAIDTHERRHEIREGGEEKL